MTCDVPTRREEIKIKINVPAATGSERARPSQLPIDYDGGSLLIIMTIMTMIKHYFALLLSVRRADNRRITTTRTSTRTATAMTTKRDPLRICTMMYVRTCCTTLKRVWTLYCCAVHV